MRPASDAAMTLRARRFISNPGATVFWQAGFVGVALVLGCGPSNPRPREAILRELEGLPRLYLGERSGRRLIAAGDKGAFPDEETGEMLWPALACYADGCPARGPAGEPFVFSSSRSREAPPRNPSHEVAGCPQCAASGVITAGSVRPYVIPETEKQVQRLEDEYRRRVELESKRY